MVKKKKGKIPTGKLSPADIESRRQAHLEKVKRGGR